MMAKCSAVLPATIIKRKTDEITSVTDWQASVIPTTQRINSHNCHYIHTCAKIGVISVIGSCARCSAMHAHWPLPLWLALAKTVFKARTVLPVDHRRQGTYTMGFEGKRPFRASSRSWVNERNKCPCQCSSHRWCPSYVPCLSLRDRSSDLISLANSCTSPWNTHSCSGYDNNNFSTSSAIGVIIAAAVGVVTAAAAAAAMQPSPPPSPPMSSMDESSNEPTSDVL